MQIQSKGWSVVLVGGWNHSILTPAGIAKYIFGLEAGKQITVAVPLDGVSAYIVNNPDETLAVHVEDNRLQIDIKKCSLMNLSEGLACGVNALKNLPVTPISGVGFNVNFALDTPSREFLKLTDSLLDKNISDQQMTIFDRSIRRSMGFGDGRINLLIAHKDDKSSVNCNFHLKTIDAELAKKWLSTSIKDIEGGLEKISKVIGVNLQEAKNEKCDESKLES